jgi:Fur family transcriptional regulator, ferric uptake regulator
MTKSYSLGSVRVTLTPIEQLGGFLQRSGKHLTQQRRMIVEQVFSHHDHFDAEELMEHLGPLLAERKLSRPTVYPTLAELVEAGLLRKLPLAGRAIYEHEYGYPQHDHLYCQNCNRLIEFKSDQLEGICDSVAKSHDFQVSGHRMFIMGLCAECRK